MRRRSQKVTKVKLMFDFTAVQRIRLPNGAGVMVWRDLGQMIPNSPDSCIFHPTSVLFAIGQHGQLGAAVDMGGRI